MKRFGYLISGLVVLIMLLPLTAFAQDAHHPAPPGETPVVSDPVPGAPELTELLSLIDDLSLAERGELLTVLLERLLAPSPVEPAAPEPPGMKGWE